MDNFTDRDRRAAELLVREASDLLRRRKPSDDDLASTLREAVNGELSPRTRARSNEIAERAGVQPSLRDSFFIELPPMARDMSVAGVSGSNYLVATGNPGAMFMESLLGASIAVRLGARMLLMDRSNGALPVIITPATTSWLSSESTAISTAAPVIGSRLAEPKAVAALVTVSRQLMVQSAPSVERVLMSELARSIAAAVDAAFWSGSGVSGQPVGVLSIPGTLSESGGSIDLSDIADMVTDVINAGSLMTSPGFGCDAGTLKVLLTRARAADVGEMIATEGTRLLGYPLQASKNGPAGLAFADWSQTYICQWNAVEVSLNPYASFNDGRISLRAIYYCDFVAAHPSSISIRTSVT